MLSLSTPAAFLTASQLWLRVLIEKNSSRNRNWILFRFSFVHFIALKRPLKEEYALPFPDREVIALMPGIHTLSLKESAWKALDRVENSLNEKSKY